jgi:hypothetical protein
MDFVLHTNCIFSSSSRRQVDGGNNTCLYFRDDTISTYLRRKMSGMFGWRINACIDSMKFVFLCDDFCG